MKPLELTGLQIGRLNVVSSAGPGPDGAIWWNCKCICGNEPRYRGSDLKRGAVKSCGCWRREFPKTRKTHGGANTRLYRIWQAMRDRTGNPRASKYGYYGGRGITVCNEWENFAVFRSWAIANGYAENLSIDRINPDGNYCPENCRWATQREQVLNRRPRNQWPSKTKSN